MLRDKRKPPAGAGGPTSLDRVMGLTMSETKSPSQTRLLLAQFLFANNIDVETLYKALGADLAECDNEAVSHMAGIIDGITLATAKIREHGLEEWAKR
ncbi:hypothetical protein SAMN06297382_1527 [Amphiplicatus metriothermophilus]|uniref:Uncharacterized protein n=2 Tax=Amphiplicatus metriothermophilus TaxID=1519374 RepID=A0A239PQC2_9PROT|nr:hypothetical protein SAMN06297382_1527 [Amphiplicatus metriothermophilus]